LWSVWQIYLPLAFYFGVHLAGFSWAELALCFVGLVYVDASTKKILQANNQFHLTLYSGEMQAKFAIC